MTLWENVASGAGGNTVLRQLTVSPDSVIRDSHNEAMYAHIASHLAHAPASRIAYAVENAMPVG